jgi:hypothetical protein
VNAQGDGVAALVERDRIDHVGDADGLEQVVERFVPTRRAVRARVHPRHDVDRAVPLENLGGHAVDLIDLRRVEAVHVRHCRLIDLRAGNRDARDGSAAGEVVGDFAEESLLGVQKLNDAVNEHPPLGDRVAAHDAHVGEEPVQVAHLREARLHRLTHARPSSGAKR